MKYVLLLVGTGLAFVLGYLSEPAFRNSLTAARTPAPAESKEAPDSPEVAPSEPETVAHEPEPEPATDPEPDPGPAPEPDTGGIPGEPIEEPDAIPFDTELEFVRLSDDEIREIMVASLEQEEIGHFKADQIVSWNAFGEKEIDGELIHYARVDYVEETTFGERTFEAKALIRDGRVEKWIWTRSGLRIE